MSRLTLHIGSHKTGTTTVQATFQHNQALFLQRGIGYARGSSLPNLHQFLSYREPKSFLPAGFKVHDGEALARALTQSGAEHVFASSENFSFFFEQAAVDELARIIQPLFDEVRIIVYLRRQDRHAISHHQEGAKPNRRPESALWGHGLGALPKPAPEHWLYLDYDRRIAMWEKAFGTENLTVRLFDRNLLRGGDIVTDLLALMDVDATGLVRVPDVNVSLGRVMTKVGHIANETLGSDKITAALLQALPSSPQRMLPSAAEAEAFLTPYRIGNRRLNARLGVTEFADLFPDDFDDYPAAGSEDLTPDEAELALRAVIRALGGINGTATPLSVDDLRMAASSLMKQQPESALRLIKVAQEMRPNGPTIQKVRGQIEAVLAKRGA